VTFFVVRQRNIIWRYNYDKDVLDVGYGSAVIPSAYERWSIEASCVIPRWRRRPFHTQGCLHKEWCNRFDSLIPPKQLVFLHDAWCRVVIETVIATQSINKSLVLKEPRLIAASLASRIESPHPTSSFSRFVFSLISLF
jgi:hypothetical protein